MKTNLGQTARFWHFENDDWVRIELRPGQVRKWTTYGRDEEGWSARGYVWAHTGDAVIRRGWSDGVDCDGRLSRGWTDRAELSELEAVPAYRNPIFQGRIVCRPEWQEVSSEQRDYAAEAMGY